MASAINANTTCDIYRNGHTPPANPDVAGVPCNLIPDFQAAHQNVSGSAGGGLGGTNSWAVQRWTHRIEVDVTVDIRDDYNAGAAAGNPDSVWIPDKNGVQYTVRFVQTRFPKTAQAIKEVFIDRGAPTWTGGTIGTNNPGL